MSTLKSGGDIALFLQVYTLVHIVTEMLTALFLPLMLSFLLMLAW